jgi:hypothetical protein
LLLDDGRVVLDVVNVENNTRVNTTVVVGGDLSNNKGINLLGGGLSAAALTDKDKEDIKTIAKIMPIMWRFLSRVLRMTCTKRAFVASCGFSCRFGCQSGTCRSNGCHRRNHPGI